jgi:hypothetical protein
MRRAARGEELRAELFKQHGFGEVLDKFQHLHGYASQLIPSNATENLRQVFFKFVEVELGKFQVVDTKLQGRVITQREQHRELQHLHGFGRIPGADVGVLRGDCGKLRAVPVEPPLVHVVGPVERAGRGGQLQLAQVRQASLARRFLRVGEGRLRVRIVKLTLPVLEDSSSCKASRNDTRFL